MFKIGEFSKLCGLSIDTLYHYEKMKILVPDNINEYTGYRSYDAARLITVNKLLALKDAGFSLDEIAKILNNNLSNSVLLEMLEIKALSLENELKSKRERLERLHTNIFLIKNGGVPVMNEISIKKVEPIFAASIRKSFTKDRFDDELEIMWSDVNRHIDEKGGRRTIPCMMIYYTGWVDLVNWTDTGEQPLDVEVVEPMIRPIEGNKIVRVYELPAVQKMACIVHKGPFTSISKTNEMLYDWIKNNGYIAVGTLREIYHKGEWATDNPDEYITELQVPLI